MTEPKTMLVRDAQVRLRGDAERAVDVIASTEAVDSYDSVLTKNWRLERYLANPVVLFAHKSRELPIGRAENVRVEDGELRARLVFTTAETNPVAEQVWRSINEGLLRGVSVGFTSNSVRVEKRDGRELLVLDDNELVEISVTPVPANPEALAQMRARAAGAAPARPQLPPETRSMKNIALALDLPAEAEESALVQAVVQMRTVVTATGKETATEALGYIEGLKVRAARADMLAQELETLRARDERRERQEIIKTAEEAGKLPPGSDKLREQLLSLPLDGARTLADALPVQVKRAPEVSRSAKPARDENRFARALGISDTQAEESRKALETRGAVRREQE